MKQLLQSAILLSLSLMGISTNAQQTTPVITGKLIYNQQPIESVMVSLLNPKDSSTLKTTITNQSGQFSLTNAPKGRYLLLANLVGFERTYYGPFEWNGSTSLMLPTLSLKSLTKGLSEVTVSSKKPMIEQKADRTIVNVEASPTNAGATAFEILAKSPGMSVD